VPVKVILLQTVRNLGEPGKLVDVSDGYARNYLLPRKLAVVADEGNVRHMAHHKRETARRLEKMAADAGQVAQRLEELTLVVKAKAGEAGRLYGSVTAADIADELARSHGLEVDKRRIDIADAIKSLGEHVVSVRLHGDVKAALKVNVEPIEVVEERLEEMVPAEEAEQEQRPGQEEEPAQAEEPEESPEEKQETQE
jgi:large subunit ribosomal protein L9